jgi:hypothetical protein
MIVISILAISQVGGAVSLLRGGSAISNIMYSFAHDMMPVYQGAPRQDPSIRKAEWRLLTARE